MEPTLKLVPLVLCSLILVGKGLGGRESQPKRTAQLEYSTKEGRLVANGICMIARNFGVLTRVRVNVVYDVEALDARSKGQDKVLMARKTGSGGGKDSFVRLEVDDPKLREKLVREAPLEAIITGFESIEANGTPTLDEQSPTDPESISDEAWRLDQVFRVMKIE